MRKMSCISFVAIYILLFFVSVNAQLKTPPAIEWQRTLGCAGEDYAYCIQLTTDGGYIVAGASSSNHCEVTGNHGLKDFWIVKLDNIGSIEWQKTLGGSDDDVPQFIQQTTDGGYIVTGYSESSDGDLTANRGWGDAWVVKLTSVGVIEWQQSLGGSRDDASRVIQQTTDGGYVMAGSSDIIDGHGDDDYWIVKFTSAGLIEWQKLLGGSKEDEAYSIQQTIEGGYIVAGWSHSTDGDVTGHHGGENTTDYWVVKLTNLGAIEWERSFGGSDKDLASSIQQTKDGGYILAGQDGNDDYWLLKLNMTGEVEWQKVLGGSNWDFPSSIQETPEGGYIVVGGSKSSDRDITINRGGWDFWIVKLTSTGLLEWQKSLGGSSNDGALSFQQTADSGYILAGYTYSSDGNVIGNHGDADYWVVKLSFDTSKTSIKNTLNLSHPIVLIPNPAQTSATLSLQSDEEGICEVQIISVTGVTLKQYSTRLVTGKQEIALTDLESLPSGMYEVVVKRNGYVAQQTKLIIE